MRRSREWLRKLWQDSVAGLAAVGQSFGAFTPPECYGLLPAAPTAAVDGRAFPPPPPPPPPLPGPGHPERLVAVPLSALSAREQAVWGQLAGVWEGVDAEVRTRRSRPRRPGPRHE
ncbi:hypothetical protein ACIGEZ_23460 [Streptomyces sp. NPDC085481]|uniref:hypothetical protein n=1 Tax=Streptomyces sp. NPDC085481 TaxID=3365727 RepID=UPI0037D0E555